MYKCAVPWIPTTWNMFDSRCVWSILCISVGFHVLIAIYIYVLCKEVDFETYVLNISLSSLSV
jgi:type IV secretory pathway component VirB8